VEGAIGAEAYLQAFPKANGNSRNALRVRACELERRPEVADTIGKFRAEAMQKAVVEGAALVRGLAQEIASAANVEDAAAVKEHLDRLEEAAIGFGADGLQVRASVCACRVKLIEVLGRIRLQAYSQLVKYAAKGKGANGNGDTPVAVRIFFGEKESEHEGFPLPNPPDREPPVTQHGPMKH